MGFQVLIVDNRNEVLMTYEARSPSEVGSYIVNLLQVLELSDIKTVGEITIKKVGQE